MGNKGGLLDQLESFKDTLAQPKLIDGADRMAWGELDLTSNVLSPNPGDGENLPVKAAILLTDCNHNSPYFNLRTSKTQGFNLLRASGRTEPRVDN